MRIPDTAEPGQEWNTDVPVEQKSVLLLLGLGVAVGIGAIVLSDDRNKR